MLPDLTTRSASAMRARVAKATACVVAATWFLAASTSATAQRGAVSSNQMIQFDKDNLTSDALRDTGAPRGRKESFFHDEFANDPRVAAEQKETTSSRTARLAAERDAATTESLRRNDEWLAANKTRAALPAGSLKPAVRLGNETLFDEPEFRKLVAGKRVGLLTNATGLDSQLVPTIDKFAAAKDIKLVSLFAPEHGIRGVEYAGEKVKSTTDTKTGVPIYSLHGEDARGPLRKPRPAALRDLDVLIYDIQDIGNRSYTYPGTMKLAMQACAENGKKFIVLDRPNPLGGNLVSGNILDPEYTTLVGWGPVAYLYGMTPGETAQYLNKETGINCDLTVVPMRGYTRTMTWRETGLPWTPPSPHVPNAETAFAIAITGMIGEMHVVNEGVGYPQPFYYAAAPWINAERLAEELNARQLPGIVWRPAYYKPYYHLFKDQTIGGVQIIITDYAKIQPAESGLHLIDAINRLYPEQQILDGGKGKTLSDRRSRISMFNKVWGTNKIRAALKAGTPAAEIIKSWAEERKTFEAKRKTHLIY